MRLRKLTGMLKWIAAAALIPCVGHTQAADEELAAVRDELQELRRDYDERIAALEARLSDMLAAGLEPLMIVGHGYASTLPDFEGERLTPNGIGQEN